MGLYLGLDASTQSLSAVVIDSEAGQVVRQEAVNFGQDLPEYRSPHGFLPNPDAQLRHADPAALGSRARSAVVENEGERLRFRVGAGCEWLGPTARLGVSEHAHWRRARLVERDAAR